MNLELHIARFSLVIIPIQMTAINMCKLKNDLATWTALASKTFTR